MMGLLSQLREAANHIGSIRSSRIENEESASKVLRDHLEKYTKAAEAKFEESVTRIHKLYDNATEQVEGKTSTPRDLAKRREVEEAEDGDYTEGKFTRVLLKQTVLMVLQTQIITILTLVAMSTENEKRLRMKAAQPLLLI